MKGEARRVSTFATFVRDGSHSTGTTFLCLNSGVVGYKCKEFHSELTEALGNVLFHTEQSIDGQQHSNVEDLLELTGRPKTVYANFVRAVIAQCLEDDRRWSLQQLQAHISIDQTTVHKILRPDLHMRKIAAKWVPHALNEQQKWCRYEMSYSSGKVSK